MLRENGEVQMAMVVDGEPMLHASWWRPPILPSGLGRFREAQITPRFARQVDFIANMLCSKHLSNWGFDILKPNFFYLDTKNCFNNSRLASLG